MKTNKIPIKISWTNNKRLQAGTHTVQKVLTLEGINCKDNFIDYKGDKIHINNIRFVCKSRKK